MKPQLCFFLKKKPTLLLRLHVFFYYRNSTGDSLHLHSNCVNAMQGHNTYIVAFMPCISDYGGELCYRFRVVIFFQIKYVIPNALRLSIFLGNHMQCSPVFFKNFSCFLFQVRGPNQGRRHKTARQCRPCLTYLDLP